jgi:hypothetical protein
MHAIELILAAVEAIRAHLYANPSDTSGNDHGVLDRVQRDVQSLSSSARAPVDPLALGLDVLAVAVPELAPLAGLAQVTLANKD